MRWLLTHRQCFHFPPCNIHFRKNVLLFNLTSITHALTWEISETGAFLTVRHVNDLDSEQDTFWDGLISYDIDAQQSPNGDHYCHDCEPQYRQFYPTRQALWESHCFDPILSWCNQHISASKHLILYRMGSGSTWAHLTEASEWIITQQSKPDCLYKVIPVMAASQQKPTH